MDHSTNITAIPAAETPRTLFKHFGIFIAGMVGTFSLCLGAYAGIVDRLIDRSAIPASYKWFLLKETPGPRIIFESGSNSHHAINTDAVGEALGRTAINIADNGGYALEDKITRLETYTRPGDVVVLPLEWSYYHREKLTDDYVETLFGANQDYYRSMPKYKRIKRALSLPPATVISKFRNPENPPRQPQQLRPSESPAQDLFISALTQPTGHQSRPTSSGPGAGTAEQSCDDYILGKSPIRQNLKLGKNIKPALTRLKKLKSRGVDIHFAWPVLAGEGCLTAPAYVDGFRSEIEDAVKAAGFDFFGTPSQSLYGQAFQDDTPYHIITDATDIHTQQMIGFLKAQGYGAAGDPLNMIDFARHRLFELELADVSALTQTPLEFGEVLSLDNAAQRDQIDFAAGWWGFEPYGRWMRDNRAMFRVTLPDNLPANSVLKIQGLTKSGRTEQVHISVNGSLVTSGLFGNGLPLSIPLSGLPKGEALSIFIDLPEAGEPRSPKDMGENSDARSMTLHLQTMELTQPSEILAPETIVVEPNTEAVTVTVTAEAEARPVNQLSLKHGNGWWAQETAGRWMQREEANFSMTLPERLAAEGPKNYLLKLSGDYFAEKPNAIGVTIDGTTTYVTDVANDGSLSIRFTTLKVGEEIDVTLKLSVPEIKSPKDLGISTDERTLTYFLKSVELEAA